MPTPTTGLPSTWPSPSVAACSARTSSAHASSGTGYGTGEHPGQLPRRTPTGRTTSTSTDPTRAAEGPRPHLSDNFPSLRRPPPIGAIPPGARQRKRRSSWWGAAAVVVVVALLAAIELADRGQVSAKELAEQRWAQTEKEALVECERLTALADEGATDGTLRTAHLEPVRRGSSSTIHRGRDGLGLPRDSERGHQRRVLAGVLTTVTHTLEQCRHGPEHAPLIVPDTTALTEKADRLALLYGYTLPSSPAGEGAALAEADLRTRVTRVGLRHRSRRRHLGGSAARCSDRLELIRLQRLLPRPVGSWLLRADVSTLLRTSSSRMRGCPKLGRRHSRRSSRRGRVPTDAARSRLVVWERGIGTASGRGGHWDSTPASSRPHPTTDLPSGAGPEGASPSAAPHES